MAFFSSHLYLWIFPEGLKHGLLPKTRVEERAQTGIRKQRKMVIFLIVLKLSRTKSFLRCFLTSTNIYRRSLQWRQTKCALILTRGVSLQSNAVHLIFHPSINENAKNNVVLLYSIGGQFPLGPPAPRPLLLVLVFLLSNNKPKVTRTEARSKTKVASRLIFLRAMALLYRGESRWKILRHPVFWVKVVEIVSNVTIRNNDQAL